MRALLAGLLLLSGCVVYEPPTYRSLPPREPTARRVLTQEQVEDVAFRLCQDRGLRVQRVTLAQLDQVGRWHVTLEGDSGDRAAMLLDAQDGKLLKGRFRQHGAGAPPPPTLSPSGLPAAAPPPPPAATPPPAADELD
jgi:acetolactate synthase regulatory subunit